MIPMFDVCEYKAGKQLSSLTGGGPSEVDVGSRGQERLAEEEWATAVDPFHHMAIPCLLGRTRHLSESRETSGRC